MATFGFAQFLITSARGSFSCEYLTAKSLPYITYFKYIILLTTYLIFSSVLWRYEDGQVGDANINTQDVRIQKEILRVIGGQSTWLLHHCDALKHLRTMWTDYEKELPQNRCLSLREKKGKPFCKILISIWLISVLVSIYVMFAALLLLCHEKCFLSLTLWR